VAGRPLVPGADQALGILKHLAVGRVLLSRFLVARLPALFLQFPLVVAHRLARQSAPETLSAGRPCPAASRAASKASTEA
jgi:hypothetical protein